MTVTNLKECYQKAGKEMPFVDYLYRYVADKEGNLQFEKFVAGMRNAQASAKEILRAEVGKGVLSIDAVNQNGESYGVIKGFTGDRDPVKVVAEVLDLADKKWIVELEQSDTNAFRLKRLAVKTRKNAEEAQLVAEEIDDALTITHSEGNVPSQAEVAAILYALSATEALMVDPKLNTAPYRHDNSAYTTADMKIEHAAVKVLIFGVQNAILCLAEGSVPTKLG